MRRNKPLSALGRSTRHWAAYWNLLMNFGMWEGHYELLDHDGNSMRLVRFRANLSRRLLRWFSGLIVEESSNGVPENGRVSGWWRGRTLVFEKQHEHLWVLSNNGDLLTLDQWAQSAHGSSLSFKCPARTPPISHAGILNDNDSSVMGFGTFHRCTQTLPRAEAFAFLSPMALLPCVVLFNVRTVHKLARPSWRNYALHGIVRDV